MVCVELLQAEDQRMNQLFDVTFNFFFFFNLEGEKTEPQVWLVLWSCSLGEGGRVFRCVCVCVCTGVYVCMHVC